MASYFNSLLAGYLRVLLLAPVLAFADDYRLEESIYPMGSPMQHALRLKHNSPEKVTGELNDPEIREIIGKAAGVTNLANTKDLRLKVTSAEWGTSATSKPSSIFSSYTLHWPTLEEKDRFSEAFQEKIRSYLRIRLIGHTRAFAVASLSQPPRPRGKPPGSKDVVTRTFKEVPESWLKLWKEEGKPVGYYLVDGELAWTFRFSGVSPWCEVVDAQEFDAELEKVFAEARAKATANLKARGIVRQLGYCHVYWPELKKVLLHDYKIWWWCPSDLNEGIYD